MPVTRVNRETKESDAPDTFSYSFHMDNWVRNRSQLMTDLDKNFPPLAVYKNPKVHRYGDVIPYSEDFDEPIKV